MSKDIFSIAIDGPAGAGKSTVARLVAGALGAHYLDTGAMYRAVGLYMKRRGITSPTDIAARVKDADVHVRFVGDDQHVLLGEEDVTSAIRTQEAGGLASAVGTIPAVREYLVALQREIASGTSVVMDGRDIGTAVLPNADLKIFLTASAEIRAERRRLELEGRGQAVDPDQVLKEIVARDYNDSHRAASPLKQAEDAVLLDTSRLSAREAADQIIALAAKKL